MTDRDRPPYLATRLLEAALPHTPHSQALLGDLHEEFTTRLPRGRRRAGAWYTWQALSIALRYRARNLGRRRRIALRGGNTRSWSGFLDRIFLNLRYVLRRLRGSPGFTLVAILSLALGIGANTAMFSIVNAVAIRDLPYENPEALVNVYGGVGLGPLSYPDYEDLVEGTGNVFQGVSGTQFAFIQAGTDDGSGVEMLWGEAVTGNYFSLAGVQPEIGRLIGPADHVAPGAHPVVVLGHGFWERRFNEDPAAVGSEVRIGGRPYTIIGVVPETFTGRARGFVSDAYVPIMMFDEVMGSEFNTLEARDNHGLFATARLRPGVSVDQAEEVALRVSNDLRARYPESWPPERGFSLVPTEDVIVNPAIDAVLAPAGIALMVVVGLVLLIACSNLASFLLARAVDRRKEVAVRIAMGARRRSLVGQLLIETLLMSGAGGLLGAVLSVRALRALMAADLTEALGIPITIDLSPDAAVLVFVVLVSVSAGALVGLIPAFQGTRPELASALRDESAGGGMAKSARLRSALVIGQVSASVILLVGAGLLLRSLDAAQRVDPGFGDAPTGILGVRAQAGRYSGEEAVVYFEALKARIARLPYVESVGYASNIPLNQVSSSWARVAVEGIDPPPGVDFHTVDRTEIDADFLGAAGIQLVGGRALRISDDMDSEPVVLVNREFERRFFPRSEALGQTIEVNDIERRIVGVTADTKVRQLGEPPRPYLFLSHRQTLASWVIFLARGEGDEREIATAMFREARALDPDIMIFLSTTMRQHLGLPLLATRLGAGITSALALLALLLAGIGLYGVVSYAVASRSHEVGIRISLGADAGSVVRMLTGTGMKLVGVGLALGLVASAALARLVAGMLYGVPAFDILTFVGVSVVLGTVALAASWIPARRVTSVSPVAALRSHQA